MKSSKIQTAQRIGMVTIVVSAIALIYAICNRTDVWADAPQCEPDEVFRWSDQACYVPQGE